MKTPEKLAAVPENIFSIQKNGVKIAAFYPDGTFYLAVDKAKEAAQIFVEEVKKYWEKGSQNAAQRWISVEEELPEAETGEDLLVYPTYEIAHFFNKPMHIAPASWWINQNGDEIFEVTHWMPLPKKPKE